MAGKTDGFLAGCCFKHPPSWWTFSECAMFIHVCQLDPKFPLLNPDCSGLNPNICCLILNVSLLDFPRSGSNPTRSQKYVLSFHWKKHEKTWCFCSFLSFSSASPTNFWLRDNLPPFFRQCLGLPASPAALKMGESTESPAWQHSKSLRWRTTANDQWHIQTCCSFFLPRFKMTKNGVLTRNRF